MAENEANMVGDENLTPVKEQTKGARSLRNKFDINDELDYEEEETVTARGANVGNAETNRRTNNADDDDDSDGEVKSNKASDLDDGEVESPKAAPRKESEQTAEAEEKPKEDEEDGEINDGERLKKTFIPRKMCKYYQRGKCTWGRTCKFLHPGVNDTGNYSFLEYQDPNAPRMFQAGAGQPRADGGEEGADGAEPIKTETAWERGLRHAKEMKEKAMRRKQMEKEQFEDKKMNLSLKEFETEEDNDERYINVEKAPQADDLDEDEMNFYASTSNRPKQPTGDDMYNPYHQGAGNFRNQSRFDGGYYNEYGNQRGGNQQQQQQMGASKNSRPQGSRRSPSPGRGGAKSRADEWHDPWDRSHKSRKSPSRRDRSSNSYSSSDSDSRSRSRSYSSSSSSRSRSDSRSYSSRSRSGLPAARRKDSARAGTKAKKSEARAALTGKSSLPGRNISEVSLKKAEAGKKSKRTRSRSNSSSSYSSSKSGEDDDDIDNVSDNDDSEDDSDGSKNKGKSKAKRAAKGAGGDSKRLKGSPTQSGAKAASSKTAAAASKPTDKEKEKKNQLIKEQLKLLENAINKKKAMAK